MKLSPEPILAYVSRGLFLGGIASICFLPMSPPPVALAPVAMFVLCEITSIILGLKSWPARPAKVGAIGSIILGVGVIAIFCILTIASFNARETLKGKVMQLENAVQNFGTGVEKQKHGEQ